MPYAFDPDALRYPVIHRRKVPFRPVIEVPDDFTDKMVEIRDLDNRLNEFYLSAEDYFELVTDAFSSNIHRATEIEGNPLDLEEVRRTSRRRLAAGSHEAQTDWPHQEIINHLLIWFRPNLYRHPWDLRLVRGTHRFLMRGVDEDARPGRFREDDGTRVWSDADEELFKPAPWIHIERELESLLVWVNRSARSHYPVAGAAVLFHEFESIHPFENGNGRVGRTLFHAYLQQNGLPNAHLCTIEENLLRDKELYYGLLAWADQEEDYTPLLDHFATAVVIAYRDAVAAFRKKDLLSTGLDETSRRLLIEARRRNEWFSVQDAGLWIAARSDQTVRKHLNELADVGALEAQGRTRAKRYRFANPFRTFQEAQSPLDLFSEP